MTLEGDSIAAAGTAGPQALAGPAALRWIEQRVRAALGQRVRIADGAERARDGDESSSGYSFAVELRRDPSFGPVIALRAGGRLAPLLPDESLCLLPIDERAARSLLAELPAARQLDGIRGSPPGDRDALLALLLALGDAHDPPQPLLAAAGAVLLTAHVGPHGATVTHARVAPLPAGHSARAGGTATAGRIAPLGEPGTLVAIAGDPSEDAAAALAAGSWAVAGEAPVAVITQRVDLAAEIVRRAGTAGVRFGRVIAGARPGDLDPGAALASLAGDPTIRSIVLCVEEVHDGPRFARALAALAAERPVVVLRGGYGAPGMDAAGLAGAWHALLRQVNAIAAENVDQMVHILQAIRAFAPPAGRGVCLFGNGGGTTVTATDACSRAGLTVPRFDPATEERLMALGIPAGTSVKNPVDAPGNTLRREEGRSLEPLLRAAMTDPHVHSVIVHLNLQTLSWLAPAPRAQQIIGNMVDAVCAVGQSVKPLALSLRSSGEPDLEAMRRREEAKAIAARIPAYPNLPTACEALARYVGWGETHSLSS